MNEFPNNRIERILNDSRDRESMHLPTEEVEELDDVSVESKNRAGDSHSGSGNHHPGLGNPGPPSAIGNRGPQCGDDQERRDLLWNDCGMWSTVRRWCAKPRFNLLHGYSRSRSLPCEVTSAAISFRGSRRKQNEDCWHVSFQPADEVSVVDLHPDDRLILCSDGLFNTLADSEIANALAISDSASEAARRLEGFAKAASARDDTTCIVVYADSDESDSIVHHEARALQETNRARTDAPTWRQFNFLSSSTPIK